MCFDCKDYHISSNNSLPSINCLPLLGIFKLSPPSNTGNCPPPPYPFLHLLFLLSSRTDQWWFKLWRKGYWHWKLIKEPYLEHMKSPCSVYLMRNFFFFLKYLGQTSSERYNFEIIAFPRIIAPLWCEKKIAPGYYLRKYSNWHSLLYLESHNFTIYVLLLWVYSWFLTLSHKLMHSKCFWTNL